MYEDLIKRLRDSEHEIDCSLCDRDCCYPDGKVHGKCIIIEAADAMKEMSRLHEAQRQNLITLMNEEPEPKWIPVTERLPEPHKDVLVSGMEAINNSRVYKVMVNDDGIWRPRNYAPSIIWDYWMPIDPPKEE